MYDKNDEQVDYLIDGLFKKKLLEKCYYEFNGIISLGQFISLGMTLVGLLSKVHSILTELRPQKKQDNSLAQALQQSQQIATGMSGEDLGEDLGSEITPETIVEPKPKIPSQTSKDKVKKKPKKKKKKSDIDLIFG